MNLLLEELRWRGLLQDVMPGTDEQLNREMTAAYVGFDPTADSLHIGSLVPIILLMHLQKAGHKPIAVLGGATGMVGDPSGKSEERNMMSIDQIRTNIDGVRKQLAHFLRFENDLPNKAELLDNYEWLKNMTFLDFIRDVGKHITVNYMLGKDSVQRRLETGMSFTEFTYQLVQGYDFYYLNQHHNVKLQMGGSDQWGNMVTGTELIRRKSSNEAFAFTAPLLKKADGGKFGKTETGNIWLDPVRTSPYRFYQFWLNTSDDDAKNYIKIFTFLPQAEIEVLISEHDAQPHLRLLQKTLSRELTVMVHNQTAYDAAVEASQILFSDNTTAALQQLNKEQLLDILDGVPQFTLGAINEAPKLIDVLASTGIMPSKGEARKMIQSGAIGINKQKVSDVDYALQASDLLQSQYILVQKGKKNYYLLTLEA
jgi:tyrosyl-tRNA synthetase